MCTQIISRSLLGTLIIFLSAFNSTTLNAQLDLNKGCIIHYPCDEVRVINKSLNRLPCTDAISNGISLAVGKEASTNSAYYFNSLDDHIRLANAPQFEKIAISLWFKSEGLSQGTLIGYKNGAYRVGLAQNGKIEASLAISSYDQYHFFSNNEKNYNDSQWHHIVLNFTGTSFDIYIDGIQAQAQNKHMPNSSIFYNDQTTLHIGSLPGQASFFNGKIDEVMIYNRPLSKVEIQVLHQAKRISFKENLEIGLLIQSSFEGSVLENESHSCVKETKGEFLISGKMNGHESAHSVKLNGINNAIVFGEALQTPEFSFGCWINTNSAQKSYIASWETDGFSLVINPADSLPGQIVARMKLSAGESITLKSEKRVNDGEWHQVFLTFDGETLRLYCDNILMDEKEIMVGLSNGVEYRPGTKLIIGGNLVDENVYFDGMIDDVLMYNYALKPTDIGFLFMPSLSKKESPIQDMLFIKSKQQASQVVMIAAFNRDPIKHDLIITNQRGTESYGKKRRIAPNDFILEEVGAGAKLNNLKVNLQ